MLPLEVWTGRLPPSPYPPPPASVSLSLSPSSLHSHIHSLLIHSLLIHFLPVSPLPFSLLWPLFLPYSCLKPLLNPSHFIYCHSGSKKLPTVEVWCSKSNQSFNSCQKLAVCGKSLGRAVRSQSGIHNLRKILRVIFVYVLRDTFPGEDPTAFVDSQRE